MHGPCQPQRVPNAVRPGPADCAAASLRKHLAEGALGGASTDEAGNVAAADEIERACFSPFVATPCEQYARLVTLGSILASDVVCDLGFGDGALLCGIITLTNCTGCGCEIDSERVTSARALAVSSGIGPDRLTLTESGISRYMLTPDFNAATVIFCFLVPRQLEALLPLFERALVAGARIISQRYQIPGMVHMRCVDGGSRLAGHAAKPDPFAFIADLDELQATRAKQELYIPDQGPAFLYSKGL